MTFREWIADYPDLTPCKYCTWFKMLCHRHYSISEIETKQDFHNIWTTLLYCSWGVEHIISRDTEPWKTGTCKYFDPKRGYKYLEEEFKK